MIIIIINCEFRIKYIYKFRRTLNNLIYILNIIRFSRYISIIINFIRNINFIK